MATPMLRARQALRIIDRFERATAEGRGAAPGPSTTRELSGLDREHNVRGPNSTVQETVGSGSLEPLQGSSGQRSLQRPPSHTAVDIPELATRDSATVSSSNCLRTTKQLVCQGMIQWLLQEASASGSFFLTFSRTLCACAGNSCSGVPDRLHHTTPFWHAVPNTSMHKPCCVATAAHSSGTWKHCW